MENNLIYNKICREVLFGPLTRTLDKTQQEQDHSGEYKKTRIEFELEPYLRRIFDKLYDQLPNYRKAIDAIDHVSMTTDDSISDNELTDFDLGKKWEDAYQALNNLVEANVMHAIELLVIGLRKSGKYEIDSYRLDKNKILLDILPQLSIAMSTLRKIDKSLSKHGISSNIAPDGFLLTVHANSVNSSHIEPMFHVVADNIDNVSLYFDKSFATNSADALKTLNKAISIIEPFLKTTED